MSKIKIMIMGCSPREVPIQPGETLRGVIKRLSRRDFPLGLVGVWYYDGAPVPSTKTLILRDGMVLAGSPAMSSTSFTIRCWGFEWTAWADLRYGDRMGLDSLLLRAVNYCLKVENPSMSRAGRNAVARTVCMTQDWYADGELIDDPAHFSLALDTVISAGKKWRPDPIVKLDMRVPLDIHKHNWLLAKKLERPETDLRVRTLRITPGEMLVDLISRIKFEKEDMGPYPEGHIDAGKRLVREVWVHGEKVDNPSTFALWAGMPIDIFYRHIKDEAA